MGVCKATISVLRLIEMEGKMMTTTMMARKTMAVRPPLK
jgi:hypothetical protein